MKKILLVEDNESAVKRIRQYIKNISADLDILRFRSREALGYIRVHPRHFIHH